LKGRASFAAPPGRCGAAPRCAEPPPPPLPPPLQFGRGVLRSALKSAFESGVALVQALSPDMMIDRPLAAQQASA
jgi:hypothetical protein